MLLEPDVSIPVPPVNVKDSESKSIANAPPESAWKSRSCAVSCASTYALIDCCVASEVALLLPNPSSSNIVVTVAPLVPIFKFSKTTVPVPLALIFKSSFDLLVESVLSLMLKSLRTMLPVPAVVMLKSACEGAVNVEPIDMISARSSSVANSNPLPAALVLRTCPADPNDVSPVPPFATGTDSPVWNSAIPVATLSELKTTRTGVLSAISFSFCPRPYCPHRMDILSTSVFIACF